MPDPLTGLTLPPQLAGAVHAAWVTFATTGDRGRRRYDLGQSATMRSVDDPRAAGPCEAVR